MIELIRETIDVERLVGEGASQALVEGEVLVPGAGRDPVNVLLSDANIVIGSVEVQNERVALDGTVVFKVLYTVGDNPRVRGLEATCGFNHALDIKGAGPKMRAEVIGDIEHAEAAYDSGRMTLRAVTKLRSRVKYVSPVACVSEIMGVDDLQSKTVHISSLRTCAEGVTRTLLSDSFEIPGVIDALETLHLKSTTQTDRIDTKNGQVVVAGKVLLEACHASGLQERPLVTTKHSLPFEIEIDLAGCASGARPWITLSVQDLTSELTPGPEGGMLRLGVAVEAQAALSAVDEAEVIIDAYSPSGNSMKPQLETLNIRTYAEDYSGVDAFKAGLSLPEGVPPVGVVLGGFARPSVSQIVGADGKTFIEGVLDVCVLYLPAGGEQPSSMNEEVPFRATYDFEVLEDAFARLKVEDVEIISITSDRLELKSQLRLTSRAYRTEDYSVMLDVEEIEQEIENRNGIILYFARQGDTLWDVAKKYRTTQETIRHFNPNISELNAGDRILIYNNLRTG